ncbi:GNAT family N-acetyltransferase [Tropicibacter alexandrii]|uniref:GNAT family N-acetyltransferase n=1 Tax=Tropicibacter alexandrii TaxID=2267683 RepID=UPI000EF52732|nr:GNAT family N-acetyltransferase [Tropicibacter alexandrii]
MDDFPDILTLDDLCLRPMTPGDVPAVTRQLGAVETARWMAAVRHPFGPAEAQEILAIARDPHRRLRVIARDGVPIGCLCLVPDLWFWIDPAFRGLGHVSRALTGAIMAHVAAQGAPLLATCRADNDASRAVLASLGFSRRPGGRRMFFQSEGRALPCLDHVMTPEQWLVLHPPVQSCGAATVRPATQKDAPGLLQLLPRRGEDPGWPSPEALSRFIEEHRCRRPDLGLFVVEDDIRRVVGMVLRSGTDPAAMRFLSQQDADRCMADLGAALPGSGA